MGPLERAQVFPGAGKMGSKPGELLKVESGQHSQTLGPVRGQMQTDDAVVFFVAGPDDETGGVGPIDKADGAVVVKEQVVGHLTDGRAPEIVMSPYSQQELMLGRREAGGPGLTLAPAFEMPKPGPQGQQPGIVLVGHTHSCHDIILIRCNLPEQTQARYARPTGRSP